MLVFEWDTLKAQNNFNKHGVSFEEAASVFRDTLSIMIDDPLHSYDERRMVLIGVSEKNRILVIVFTDRRNKIRIISARNATKRERKNYEGNEK